MCIHESLFVLTMCWNLYIWMVMENSLTCADNDLAIPQAKTGNTTTNTVPSKVVGFVLLPFIIPTLFRKSVGDIVIASVRLSVRPPVRYVISSQTAGQNPIKFGEWLAYTSGACKSMFIFGPAPRGPGDGSKGQILTISNFKVNFKDFYAKMCTYIYIVIEVKHIERDLLCDPRNTLWGGTWGWGGVKI